MPAETRAFEFALGMFAVLIGLAVADIAASFHRLLRNKAHVRWDPLTLLAASYALCMAVYMWFDIWGVRHFGITRHFLFYLGLVAELFMLYLIAAASLPDETSGPVDLREYYARKIAATSGCWSRCFNSATSRSASISPGGEPPGLPRWIIVMEWTLMSAPVVISVAMLGLKSRTAHYLGLAALYVIMLLHYGASAID